MHTSAELVVQDVRGVSDFSAEHLVQCNLSYDIIIYASQTLACLASPSTKYVYKLRCNKSLNVIWYFSAQ